MALPGAYLGFENDDAQFVLAARGLAAFHSYRFFTFPGAPPVRLFTPGWPLLLAPVAALFPDRPGVFTAFAFGVLALCDVLAWLWLRKRLGERYGAAAFLLFALSPLALARAGRVMSEAPLLALTLAYLLWRERGESPTAGLNGLFLAFAWLLRPAGIALAPAALAQPLKRRDWSRALLSLLPLTAVWLEWRWWTGGYFKESSEFFTAASGGLWAAPAIAWDNLGYYAAQWGGGFWPAAIPGAALAGLFLAAAAAWGMRIELREDTASPAAWAVLGWLALHLFWPWHYARYLLPILPLLAYFTVRGLTAVQIPRAPFVFIGLLLAGQLFCCLPWITSVPVPRTPELSVTYRWIRDRTPTDAAFASLLWGRDTLYAERAFSSLPSEPNSASLAAELRRRGVRYILWYEAPDLGFSADANRGTNAALASLAAESGAWQTAYFNNGEHSRIMEVPGR